MSRDMERDLFHLERYVPYFICSVLKKILCERSYRRLLVRWDNNVVGVVRGELQIRNIKYGYGATKTKIKVKINKV